MITNFIVSLKRKILLEKETKKKLFGFPLQFYDETNDKISFERVKANIDGNNKVIKSLKYSGSSNLLIKCDIDYQRTIQTIKFFGYADMLAKLGGLKSILGPVFSILTPLFVLAFLMELSSILKQSYKNDYY